MVRKIRDANFGVSFGMRWQQQRVLNAVSISWNLWNTHIHAKDARGIPRKQKGGKRAIFEQSTVLFHLILKVQWQCPTFQRQVTDSGMTSTLSKVTAGIQTQTYLTSKCVHFPRQCASESSLYSQSTVEESKVGLRFKKDVVSTFLRTMQLSSE